MARLVVVEDERACSTAVPYTAGLEGHRYLRHSTQAGDLVAKVAAFRQARGLGAATTMIFVGDDWSEEHHDICVLDGAGRVLARCQLSMHHQKCVRGDTT